jgi:hypothetical protein
MPSDDAVGMTTGESGMGGGAGDHQLAALVVLLPVVEATTADGGDGASHRE